MDDKALRELITFRVDQMKEFRAPSKGCVDEIMELVKQDRENTQTQLAVQALRNMSAIFRGVDEDLGSNRGESYARALDRCAQQLTTNSEVKDE